MMKKFLKQIKPIAIIAFWLMSIAGLMVLLSFSVKRKNQSSHGKLKIKVDESSGLLFIDESDIQKILEAHRLSISDSVQLTALDYRMMENAVEHDPFVDDAQLYVDAQDNIAIDVSPRIPILRIINRDGVGYYLDQYGQAMPLSSKFTARVPVATGAVFSDGTLRTKNDSVINQKLFTLATYLHNDPFLSPLTEQIIVDENQEFELVPRIANHTILLGDVDHLEEKFNKLKVFYQQGLKYSGWNNYKQVNLKYENEVYATRRNASSKLKQVIKPDTAVVQPNPNQH